MKRQLLSILLICWSVSILGQIYPVRTITTVSAPYPTTLDGFVDVQSPKVNLSITPTDAKMQNYQVKLRLYIVGNGYKIYSNPNYVGTIYSLNQGETQVISGADLAAWFNPDNLIFEGYSKAQYQSDGQLPDGIVQVYFEVWDYYRDFNISASTKAMIWLFQNAPPTLNFPEDNKQLTYTDPQNINFNWAAGQSPFSLAGYTNQYKFELWEIWPDNLTADEVVQTTSPIYTTTQTSTSLIYGTDGPILETGRRYAWRVTAFDPDGKKQYTNNGHSTVHSFRFGRDCSVPDVSLEKVTTNKAILSWNNNTNYNTYTLRYRQKNSTSGNWYEQTGSATGTTLTGLNPSTQYEVQLQGTCQEQNSGYSSSLEVQTAQDLTSTCGANSNDTTRSSVNPLASLSKGDYFRAYDFDIEVESVKGSSGHFSGSGYARVPLLSFVKFKVSFSNITINSSYRMTKGQVTFDYDETNGLMVDVNSVLHSLGFGSGGGQTTFSNLLETQAVDSTVTSATVSESTVTVTIASSSATGEKIVTLQADNGLVALSNSTPGSTQSVVDTHARTVYSGSTSNGGNTQPPSSSKGAISYQVAFSANKAQDYGYDAPGNGHPEGNYPTATIGGSTVMLPWKSISGSGADRLVAAIKGTGADTAIHFIAKSGNMVMTSKGSKTNTNADVSKYDAVKQILAAGTKDDDLLRAWYYAKDTATTDTSKTPKSTPTLAGAVKLAVYDDVTINVCLVSLNGTKGVPSSGDIQKQLDLIYAPAVVKWKVSELSLKVEGLGNFAVVPSNANDKMRYTSADKTINSAIKEQGTYDGKTLYLIFTDKFAAGSPSGYMPFNCSFGYICKSNQNPDRLVKDIAHELGHGAFRLRHTFDKDNDFIQDSLSTQNLMDYNGGTELLKCQWDECHDFDWGINLLEDAGDAELKCDLYYNNKCYTNRMRFYFKANGAVGLQIGVSVKSVFPISAYARYSNYKGEITFFAQYDDIYGWIFGVQTEGKDIYYDVGASAYVAEIEKIKSKNFDEHPVFATTEKKVRQGFMEETYTKHKDKKGKWISDPTKDKFVTKFGGDVGIILFGVGVEIGVEGYYIPVN